MSVTAIGSTGSTTTTSTTSTSSLGLDSDAFLQLFIAQLQYQDPLNPADSTEMMSQLAQMTTVEQLSSATDTLTDILATQNNNLAMSAVSFIGGTVTAADDQVYFDGTNASSLLYSFSAATESTTLTIMDSSGNTVRTVDLGAQSGGTTTYEWDGCDDSGNTLASGAYTFSVSGTTTAGVTATGTTYTTGVADGVNFIDGVPYVTIGEVAILYSDIFSVTVT